MLTAIAAIVIFSLLITIHEFGHFITARLCGVSVKEFAVGMGPKLISWQSKKYETRYALRLLPFGGFVSMEGRIRNLRSRARIAKKAFGSGCSSFWRVR